MASVGKSTDAPARDPVVEALVEYLIKVQRADGAWEPEAHRPPAEESKAFVTALALRGLRWSASSQTKPQSEAADRAFEWLSSNAASAIADESIDELAGQLLAYVWRPDRFPDAKAALRRSRIKEWQDRILFLRRENGGWSQRRGMEGDPYATGLALWTLVESGVDHSAKPCQDAAAFLRIRQADDGSWHTRSRCEPFQPYFDNGDPYGRDQFLSLMATGWSTAALARLEESRP
jgi:N-acyl-D-amino-acid deacylase